MNTHSRILLVGVACVDKYPNLFASPTGASPERRSHGSLPRPGQRVVISDFWDTPGGNAANVALVLASTGVPTDLVAPIAYDQHGRFLEQRFSEAGLAFDAQVCRRETVDRDTGYSYVMLGLDGEPAFLHHPGAGEDLDVDWLRRAVSNGSYRTSKYSFLHIAGLGLLPGFETQDQLERGAAWVEELRSQHPGLWVSMDVNNVKGWSGRNWERFAPLLRQANLLTPNQAEARQMVRGRGDAPLESLSPGLALQDLCASERGRPWVIVKDGPQGGTVVDPTGSEVRYTAAPCDVVDLTGAGDNFAAGLLAGLHGGKSVLEAARQGALWAARSIERRGSTSWVRPWTHDSRAL